MNYTIVVGVDKEHLEQLKMTLPTWLAHKPHMRYLPLILFYDRDQLSMADLTWIRMHFRNTTFQAWPFADVIYPGKKGDKFSDPQRFKMLSGFIHVPALLCDTEYWLKLDTDTVATDTDEWINEDWFRHSPAIVAHRWGITKPPNQMLNLDKYLAEDEQVSKYDPLDLKPEPGAEKVCHKRIISWCGFFDTKFTRFASTVANRTDIVPWRMPVPSQDGFMWYLSTRCKRGVVRTNMKDRGWQHWLRNAAIREAVQKSLGE